MKLLKDYTDSLEALEKYFDVSDLGWYTIDINNAYFSLWEDSIGWAKTERDLEEQDGDYYLEDIRFVKEKDELTLVLVDNDMGGDNYYMIFKSENKREY